ncbi:MAG: XRE family transcriptional regulator [Sphingobacteriales bacterium]|nr:XRE family transcriptional regulator [Sphingobacteriales bacterium]
MWIKSNIKYLREQKNLSQEDFGAIFGLSRDNIASYERPNGSSPKHSVITKIVNYFNINYDDFINKDLRSEENSQYNYQENTYRTFNDKEEKYIPLIPIDAMAGFASGDVQVMEYDAKKFLIPVFQDVDFLIQVRGNSMWPKYNNGDLIGCKKLKSFTFFQWNKVYVLDTEQGALIKRVKPSLKDGCILLVSDNKEYDPFDVPIAEIRSVSIVLGLIALQ